MAKLRLGVALLVPPPLDREVDALRRATGDGTYGRVPAHLTLVPPVNVRADRRNEALRVLREAAARCRPFTLDLGPPTTFLPDNPVLYLPVREGVADVDALRDAVFRAPLARPLTWPFVPHVTIADEADPECIAAATAGLGGYSARMPVDRVHLLQEGPGRVWAPVADFPFRRPAVVGRGGLPLELTVAGRLDPEAEEFVAAHNGPHRLAVTARRDGRVVGVAAGEVLGDVATLVVLQVEPGERGQGVGSHLLAAFQSEAAARGCRRLAASLPVGCPAEGFLRGKGWVGDGVLQRVLQKSEAPLP
jgi:2'-5' RNA ligase